MLNYEKLARVADQLGGGVPPIIGRMFEVPETMYKDAPFGVFAPIIADMCGAASSTPSEDPTILLQRAFVCMHALGYVLQFPPLKESPDYSLEGSCLNPEELMQMGVHDLVTMTAAATRKDAAFMLERAVASVIEAGRVMGFDVGREVRLAAERSGNRPAHGLRLGN